MITFENKQINILNVVVCSFSGMHDIYTYKLISVIIYPSSSRCNTCNTFAYTCFVYSSSCSFVTTFIMHILHIFISIHIHVWDDLIYLKTHLQVLYESIRADAFLKKYFSTAIRYLFPSSTPRDQIAYLIRLKGNRQRNDVLMNKCNDCLCGDQPGNGYP